LISFLVVGGTGVFVHLAVLLAAMGLGLSFPGAQFLGALVAVTSNFLLNNQLTFRDQRLRGHRLISGYLKFLVISSVGVAANVSMATYTYSAVTSIPLIAAITGIALDTIWKYVVSGRLVWKE
jgi:dolichol-phosphate mannosyltransferase